MLQKSSMEEDRHEPMRIDLLEAHGFLCSVYTIWTIEGLFYYIS